MINGLIDGIRRDPVLSIRTATVVIAAYNSSDKSKAQADYVCSGVDDDVEIQAAVNALPAYGATLLALAGHYFLSNTVSRAIDNVLIVGEGIGTYFTNDGVTAIFSAGTQDGWLFQNFATDAGGIDITNATEYTLTNIAVGTDYYSYHPSGGLAAPRLKLLYTSAALPAPGVDNMRNCWVEDGYLYQCNMEGQEFRIWDVTVPSAPVHLSTLAIRCLDVRKSGNHCYVTTAGDDTVKVIDVSDPSNPVQVGQIIDSTNLDLCHGAYLAGHYLYVAAYGNNAAGRGRFTVIDILDPTIPIKVGSIQDDTYTQGAHDIVVEGKYAYLSTHLATSLTVIDISDPTNPTVVGGAAFIQQMASILKKGRYVFTGNNESIFSFDVSDPTTPVLVDSITGIAHGGCYWMDWYGDNYIIGAGSDGVTIFDVSDPTNIVIGDGAIPTGATAVRNVFVDGKYVYVGFCTAADSRFAVYEIEHGISTVGAYPLYTQNLSGRGKLTHNLYGLDAQGAEALPSLSEQCNMLQIPLMGWTEALILDGASTEKPTLLEVGTSVTADSSALRRTELDGFCVGRNDIKKIDWEKKARIVFNYCVYSIDAQSVSRLQIKEVSGIGALGAKGVGIRVDSLALVGESYGTALGEVNLGDLVNGRVYQIKVIIDSPTTIRWYVSGVLKGIQSTANTIPTSCAGAQSYLVHSINNGAGGGCDCKARLMQPRIWQAFAYGFL